MANDDWKRKMLIYVCSWATGYNCENRQRFVKMVFPFSDYSTINECSRVMYRTFNGKFLLLRNPKSHYRAYIKRHQWPYPEAVEFSAHIHKLFLEDQFLYSPATPRSSTWLPASRSPQLLSSSRLLSKNVIGLCVTYFPRGCSMFQLTLLALSRPKYRVKKSMKPFIQRFSLASCASFLGRHILRSSEFLHSLSLCSSFSNVAKTTLK
jgi:hypothetical protein